MNLANYAKAFSNSFEKVLVPMDLQEKIARFVTKLVKYEVLLLAKLDKFTYYSGIFMLI